MAINDLTLREAEKYLARFERLRNEIDYGYEEFRRRLDFYRQSPNPQSSVDLESSIAFYEKHIRPFVVEKRIVEKHYTDPRDILEIGIAQDWQAYEFRQLFQGVDYLNKLFAVRFKLTRESPDLRLRREMTRSRVFRHAELYYYLAPHEELHVKSVQFASPGSVNLEGIAVIVKEIRELLHYVFTCQFVKGFVDQVDYFRFDRPIQNAEKRMKLKEVVRQEQMQDRKFAVEDMEDYRKFLEKANQIADLATQLDQKGLARGTIVEEAFMRSLSQLHRLGFEEQKAKLDAMDHT
jgi:hypothetical protein